MIAKSGGGDRPIAGMPLDGGQLAAQAAIDQRGRTAVEPGEETFGLADNALGALVLDGGDHDAGDGFRRVTGVAEFGIELPDRPRVERGVDRPRGHMHDTHSGIGQLAPQPLGEGAQPRLGGRVGRETRERNAAERGADVHNHRRGLRAQRRQ